MSSVHEHSRTTRVQLAVSRLQGDLSARTKGLNYSHVKVLAQCADRLPPIVVHKSSLRVIDGLHRLRVAELCGQDEIDVALFDGSDEEAFALSVLLNVRHGLPLPMGDRKEAAARILLDNPDWSDRFVASLVGLSHKTISSMRGCLTGDNRQLNGRIGRDGKVRPIDPAGGRLRAAELLVENPGLPLRQLARAADISVSTARDVRLRLRKGDDPVPNRLRGSTSSTGPQLVADEQCAAEHEETAPPAAVREPWAASSPVQHKSVPFDLLLERLKKDPAVRFNEPGRNLIRQLVAAHFAVTTCHQALSFAPAHCLVTVVQLAQTHAEAWQQLAARADAMAETKQVL